jgi:thiamine biosynthesis lipoprotein
LAHPLRWEEKLGRIRLRNQAIGTSGAGKQFFHYQGVRYSHVIDPRTGWPAQGVLSATAICRSGTLADALATAFMVMGPAATATFCEQHPHIGAILVVPHPGSSRLSIVRCNVADEDWREQRLLEA